MLSFVKGSSYMNLVIEAQGHKELVDREYVEFIFPDYYKQVIKIIKTISSEHNGWFCEYIATVVTQQQLDKANTKIREIYEQQKMILKITDK